MPSCKIGQDMLLRAACCFSCFCIIHSYPIGKNPYLVRTCHALFYKTCHVTDISYITYIIFADPCCVQRGSDYKLNWTIYVSVYVCGSMIIGRTQKMLSCDWLQCFGDDQ